MIEYGVGGGRISLGAHTGLDRRRGTGWSSDGDRAAPLRCRLHARRATRIDARISEGSRDQCPNHGDPSTMGGRPTPRRRCAARGGNVVPLHGRHVVIRRLHTHPRVEPKDAELSPCSRLVCSQEITEAVLREVAIERGADVRFGCRLDAFVQDENEVSSRLTNSENDEPFDARSQYLIAADGVRGATRDRLGIGVDGPGAVGESVSILVDAPLRDRVADRSSVIYGVRQPTPGRRFPGRRQRSPLGAAPSSGRSERAAGMVHRGAMPRARPQRDRRPRHSRALHRAPALAANCPVGDLHVAGPRLPRRGLRSRDHTSRRTGNEWWGG